MACISRHNGFGISANLPAQKVGVDHEDVLQAAVVSLKLRNDIVVVGSIGQNPPQQFTLSLISGGVHLVGFPH
jgi:hypothetical protein